MPAVPDPIWNPVSPRPDLQTPQTPYCGTEEIDQRFGVNRSRQQPSVRPGSDASRNSLLAVYPEHGRFFTERDSIDRKEDALDPVVLFQLNYVGIDVLRDHVEICELLGLTILKMNSHAPDLDR